jgi:hypothetical protein
VLDRSGFAASTPDPAATERALAALATPATRAGTIATYERVWRDAGGHNEVRDVLVRFPSAVRAQAFVQAVHHSLESGEIVDSGPLRSIPGAHRVTYFASGAQARAGPTGVGTGVGVGQAITMRSGVLVALLSFLSAASADAPPISPADAARVAQAQYTAMASAPGGRPTAAPSPRGTSLGAMALAVVAVAVLALAVATPLLLRRRHPSGDRPGPTAVPGDVHPAP